jgi:glycosyltransferase involved in cell wall biosynthesis
VLAQIEDRDWLVKSPQPLLDRGLFGRIVWLRSRLPSLARAAGCDVLLVPGGSYIGGFHPIVAMSRNMLPFEWRELRRFGLSPTALRLLALRLVQSRTFRRADAVVFLTRYAEKEVSRVVRAVARSTIVPHGIAPGFHRAPRQQLRIDQYALGRPFRILYVSIVNLYKHQWHVADAVARLRGQGLPVELELIGPAYGPALRRLNSLLRRVDPECEFIHYRGAMPHAKLPGAYARADACVFASSCENMPNILLEGMAAGLPIACSDRGPMPEILGEGGMYFDPEDPESIAHALRNLIESPQLRSRVASVAFERAQAYSWTRCADETFAFLAQVARVHCGV